MANTILNEILLGGWFEKGKKLPTLAKKNNSKSIKKIHCFASWSSPLTRQIFQSNEIAGSVDGRLQCASLSDSETDCRLVKVVE